MPSEGHEAIRHSKLPSKLTPAQSKQPQVTSVRGSRHQKPTGTRCLPVTAWHASLAASSAPGIPPDCRPKATISTCLLLPQEPSGPTVPYVTDCNA